MKVSKLLNDLDGGRYLEQALQSGVIGFISDRCTGKSTGYVLEMIGKAMQNPNQKVKLAEHTEYFKNRHLTGLAEKLIQDLRLKYFSISRHNDTIEYKPFGTLKVKITVED